MNLHHKKILIVDDEVINLEFFEVMLTKLGFIVEKANDGVEALEKVKRFYPDLIMLDNIMPRMSGWELTKTLKEDPQWGRIPIIMFSALDNVKDKVESFELGVDDYITKPFNFSEVFARIRVALRNQELFAQIVARESRLRLAEALTADIKNHIGDFVKSIDELDAAIADAALDDEASRGGEHQDTLSRLFRVIRGKKQALKKHIAELDARIDKTLGEWEALKQNEIGLTVLEPHIQSAPHQE
jgi:DNA-binding response OmpR family regulator